MQRNRTLYGFIVAGLTVGLMIAPAAQAGKFTSKQKPVQKNNKVIKKNISVPEKGEAVSAPDETVSGDKPVASKGQPSKSALKKLNRLSKYLGQTPTTKKISRLGGKVKNSGQRTSSVRSLDCSSVPANTRCWYWDWIRSGSTGKSERSIGKLSCGSSSSGDYLLQTNTGFQRNPGGPDVDYRTSDYELPFEWVDQASIQLNNTSDCVFQPKVLFDVDSLQAGQSTGDVTITTDYSAHTDDAPIKDVYFNFPRGMTLDPGVTSSTGTPFGGQNSKESCDASPAKVGTVSSLTSFYLKDWPQLNFQDQPISGSVCVTSVGSGSQIGTLHAYIDSRLLGAQTGDDLVLEIGLEQANGYVKGTMLDLPRNKDDVDIGGGSLGVWIQLKRFELNFNGGIGSGGRHLITNPAPGQCSNGDKATYSAIHISWLDSVPVHNKWNPLNGRHTTNRDYGQIVWKSAGEYQGC